MKDLTKDSITLHILRMTAPAAISIVVQAAHQVITLHFVSGLGTDAVAAVSSAGNAGFIVAALGQILNVGTAALVSHGAGRKDFQDISLLLNQAFGLALVCALGTVCLLFLAAPLYVAALAQDDVVVDLGVTYLWWVSPGLALLFPMTVLGATFRGIGTIGIPTFIFTFTVVLDAIFAAVLIPGHWFIPSLGVKGAAIATTLSYSIGLIWLLAYFHLVERKLAIQRTLLVPRLSVWRRILALGLPAAAEITLMFFSMSVVYLAIRNQGASAQAGLGIGLRVLSLLMMPGLALSFAAAPIAGQNFGARNFSRVREVFHITGTLSATVMLVMTVVAHWQPQMLLGLFETDSASAAEATSFLRLMSWTLVAQGIVYTCALMFQALGNTIPPLMSAIARFIVFAGPALWLSQQPDFRTEQVWYLWAASIVVQAVAIFWLLQIEFKRKLQPIVAESNNPTATSNPIAPYPPEGPRHVDPTKTL